MKLMHFAVWLLLFISAASCMLNEGDTLVEIFDRVLKRRNIGRSSVDVLNKKELSKEEGAALQKAFEELLVKYACGDIDEHSVSFSFKQIKRHENSDKMNEVSWETLVNLAKHFKYFADMRKDLEAIQNTWLEELAMRSLLDTFPSHICKLWSCIERVEEERKEDISSKVEEILDIYYPIAAAGEVETMKQVYLGAKSFFEKHSIPLDMLLNYHDLLFDENAPFEISFISNQKIMFDENDSIVRAFAAFLEDNSNDSIAIELLNNSDDLNVNILGFFKNLLLRIARHEIAIEGIIEFARKLDLQFADFLPYGCKLEMLMKYVL